MPLTRGSSPAIISGNIREMQNSGHPHAQAVAAALHTADIARHKRASGGLSSPMMPSPARSAAHDLSHDTYHEKGLFKSDVAGRTDRIPRAVAADSFVVPADVVSGLGSGNTLAGAKMMDGMLHSGPYGTPLTKPPSIKRKDGGHSGGISHVMVAGGEYLIHRDDLARVGGLRRKTGKSNARTDLAAGHEWARHFVDTVRKQQKKFLNSAPKPKK